jgi:hypothetical protein
MAMVATLLGLVNEVEPNESPYTDWPAFFLSFCELTQNYSLVLFFCIGAIAVLSIWVSKLGDPWVWEKLQFILNEYQAKAFSNLADEPNHHHRVTIFKYCKWKFWCRHCTGRWYWPWGMHSPGSGWLVPVLRSGYTSQNTKVIFSAPDNGDEAEGVAGKAWAAQSAVIVQGLPSPTKNGPKRNVNNYCAVTACPKDMVEAKVAIGRPMPASMAATPIEVNGHIWGVVVLDSRAEDGVSRDSIIDYELTVALIGQLLEKTV